MSKVTLVVFMCVWALVFGAIAARPPKTSCREKAINEALTMTLLAGSDMRGRGKHPTWGEIEAEVKKRLRVH